MFKFVVVFGFLVQIAFQEGCNIYNFDTWDSILFSSDTLDFVYPPITNPPDNRNISLPVGATIIISCNGGHFSGRDRAIKTIAATCNRDLKLEAQDEILDFDALDCVNFRPQVARVSTAGCGPGARIIEVGFQIGVNIKFAPQVRVCFDGQNSVALYVSYNLTKSIGFIKSYLTTSYEVDSVYGVDLDFETLYENVTHQEERINKLLGLPLDSTKYVNPATCRPNPGASTPGFCFSKRHLAYKGAFVYVCQQHAAFRYVNVVPQWYFLDYNLDKLERNVIDFVKKNKFDLEIYTGTYGIATLPHSITKEKIELFLYVDGDNKALPVPLIFWKLIYDRTTRRATVFLTVNDPYQADPSENVICNDISDQIEWLTWEKHNVTKGYSYACVYEEVRNVISYLPDIAVGGILF